MFSNLSRFTRLTKFTLFVPMDEHDCGFGYLRFRDPEWYGKMIKGIFELPQTTRELVIQFDYFQDDFFRRESVSLLAKVSDWSRLERALCFLNRLESVEFRFEDAEEGFTDIFAMDEDLLRRHLPKLQDKGILSFQY